MVVKTPIALWLGFCLNKYNYEIFTKIEMTACLLLGVSEEGISTSQYIYVLLSLEHPATPGGNRSSSSLYLLALVSMFIQKWGKKQRAVQSTATCVTMEHTGSFHSGSYCFTLVHTLTQTNFTLVHTLGLYSGLWIGLLWFTQNQTCQPEQCFNHHDASSSDFSFQYR